MVDAKEYKISDIDPDVILIEILDDEQKPVREVKFDVVVDDGTAKTKETDNDGMLKVRKPKSEIKLSRV